MTFATKDIKARPSWTPVLEKSMMQSTWSMSDFPLLLNYLESLAKK